MTTSQQEEDGLIGMARRGIDVIPFFEELKARLVEYEAEATELRERLQGVESLMAHARALIQEEEHRLGESPLLMQNTEESTNDIARRISVPMMILEILPTTRAMRYIDVRNRILTRWFPDANPLNGGRQVGVALGRAVGRGTVRRISRGRYIKIAEEVLP